MAMASRAPNLRDTDMDITMHALEKLRERLPSGSHFMSMPDRDLKLRIEEAWKNAKRAGVVEEWWERVSAERGDGSTIECNFVVSLQDSFEADLVALFREDRRGNGRAACITVLTKSMAENNKTTNKWGRTPESVGKTGLLSNPLGKQIAAMELPSAALPASGTKLVAPPTPAPVAPGPRLVAAPAPPAPPPKSIPSQEVVLVTWLSAAGSGERGSMPVPKGEVSGFVDELVSNGVDLDSIEFWTKREAKVKRVVTVEL